MSDDTKNDDDLDFGVKTLLGSGQLAGLVLTLLIVKKGVIRFNLDQLAECANLGLIIAPDANDPSIHVARVVSPEMAMAEAALHKKPTKRRLN